MNSPNRRFPEFIPKLFEPVSVRIPALSSDPVYSVVYAEGSEKRRKITLYCSQGNPTKTISMQLIWKPGNPGTGWVCWLLGKKYENVAVGRA